jgi:uncharacterized membrane protein
VFADNVGDMTRANPVILPAVAFYALYIAGIFVFVNGQLPSNWTHNLLYGALFGLFCYATFELTNMSILKHWEWVVVATDIAWGAAVTAIAASVGGVLADWILRQL